MPWKLKQRTSTEIRKKVYLCPEPLCVHHDPMRALGDLTGIKKHYSRKHGEKKWKCERCSKKYAVQADWKAHMKSCGSREYKCDCGTLFSRRDSSFIMHRAFCDALAEESSRAQKVATVNAPEKKLISTLVVSSPPPPPLTPSATVLLPVVTTHSPELPEHLTLLSHHTAIATSSATMATTTTTTTTVQSSSTYGNVVSSTRVFASIFAPSTTSNISHLSQNSSTSFSHPISSMSQSDHHRQTSTILSSSTAEPPTLCLSSPYLFQSNNGFSLFPTHDQDHHNFSPLSLKPAMSATALLQKATQMGVTSSSTSFLRGLGLSMSSDKPDNTTTVQNQWNSSHVKLESHSATGLTDYMMGSASLYGNKPTTLDLLGLGLGQTNPPNGCLSALFTSFEDEEINSNYPISLYTETETNGSSLL